MGVISIIADSATTIVGEDSGYSTARSTAVIAGATHKRIGQYKPSYYGVRRSYIRFDTSSLSGKTVTKVNLKLTIETDQSVTDFDIKIQEQNWAAQDPITSGNMEAAYDGCLAESDSFLLRNTSGLATNTPYTSADLTAGYINTSGYTYYSLISSRDIGGNTPSNNEYVNPYFPDAAIESYRPTLVIEYTDGGNNGMMMFF